MNVLFLNPHPEDGRRNNLFRKFSSQVSCASKVVDDVFYTTYDSKNIYINHFSYPDEKMRIGLNYHINKNIVVMHNTMRAIRKWVKDKDINIVYIRSNPATYSYKRTFKLFKKKGSYIVVEIPTYPGMAEAKNSNRKIFFALVSAVEFLYQKVYEKYANLFTLIGEKADEYKGVPAINIENGIDISLIPPKQSFEKHDGQIHLLAVAAISYWHGYDRIVDGIVNYYSNNPSPKIDIFLHICGNSPDGSLNSILGKIKENHLEDRILYHGFLSGNDLNDIYEKCDIAIGSLGLFRQNIIVDTTLKITEYMARGIPFVYCTESNNIPNDCEFCLRIPAKEEPVNIDEVIKFFRGLTLENVSVSMRDYAKDYLDWSRQFQKVINKISEI